MSQSEQRIKHGCSLSIKISCCPSLYFLIVVELKTEKKIRELDDVIKRSLAVSTKVSLLFVIGDEDNYYRFKNVNY